MNWIKLSNGALVSKHITIKELLEMVDFKEVQSVVKQLLSK